MKDGYSNKVSVLITTYNRPALLKRAMASVLGQTYQNLELIIIDDASTDDTPNFVASCSDPRIRFYRNSINIGSACGDRPHLKRFIYDLSRGSKFIYLCVDDYWLDDKMLEKFMETPDCSMVIGNQLSVYEDGFAVEHRPPFDVGRMVAEQFVKIFSDKPIESNIIVGATLFDRWKFMHTCALLDRGARWQAGYELFLSAASQGDVIYHQKPYVAVDVRPTNASFQLTQLEHYLDCVESIKAAKCQPIDIKQKIIDNVGKAYLANAEHIKQHGLLTMCSAHNISVPVTPDDLVVL